MILKNDKKMKNTRGKLQFFIFRKIFAPLETKMMKNVFKKKMKKMKTNEKTRGKLQFFIFWKLAIFLVFFFFFHFFSFFYFFSFFIIFYHFSSIPPLEAKMIEKNEKKKINK